jgi:uncharacterized protein HemX
MKTTIRFLIGVTLSLIAGSGIGLYTGWHLRDAKAQTRVAALQQPAESAELRQARSRLRELLLNYTPAHPLVEQQRDRIRKLEAIDHTK